MQDKSELYGKTLLHHGKINNRVYLQHFDLEDFPEVVDHIEELTFKNNYTKVVAKVPTDVTIEFRKKGFEIEAYIPGFFNGEKDAFFLSKFYSSKRSETPDEELENFQKVVLDVSPNGKKYSWEKFEVRELTEKDSEALTELYSIVFETYPFPIHDPEYIRQTMRDHIRYFGVFENGKLVGASSAEIDYEYQGAEMTDFAVNPKYRGQGFAIRLLREMEKQLESSGIKTLYTIARLKSLPMNKTFLRLGYRYTGTLVNNTNIAGQIESMNVLYKPLS